jgi:hypothetical protein
MPNKQEPIKSLKTYFIYGYDKLSYKKHVGQMEFQMFLFLH